MNRIKKEDLIIMASPKGSKNNGYPAMDQGTKRNNKQDLKEQKQNFDGQSL